MTTIGFTGTLIGPSGTLGKLRVLDAIYGGGYDGWGWPNDPNVTGWAIANAGALFGNYHSGKFLQIYSDGNIVAPGFELVNAQLTLRNSIIVTPKITNPNLQTAFSISLSDLRLTGQVDNSTVTHGFTPAYSGGAGGYQNTWTLVIESGGGGRLEFVGSPSAGTGVISASGRTTWVYGWITCLSKDANGATATDSAQIRIQFGSAQEM